MRQSQRLPQLEQGSLKPQGSLGRAGLVTVRAVPVEERTDSICSRFAARGQAPAEEKMQTLRKGWIPAFAGMTNRLIAGFYSNHSSSQRRNNTNNRGSNTIAL